MTSRWKKVWADIWVNKSRTLLTILTVAVGTFAIGFNTNLNLFMNESMDGDYLSANPSEATVYGYPMDDKIVELARRVPGVDAVEGRSFASGTLVRPEGEIISIQFTGIESPAELTLNLLKPVMGESVIPSLGDKEMLVDASAAAVGYQPGDIIPIELDNGKIREVKLAGYIHDVTGIPYSFTKTFNAYVTSGTLEWLGGDPNYYSQLAISVTKNQTDAEYVTEIAQAVADRIKRAGISEPFVYVYEPGHHYAWRIAQSMFFVLGALGYLIVLVSCFLIFNTVTALMTQQVRQIGIMKAVGGLRGQIVGMYFVLIAAFGAGAMLIAVPLANYAAKSVGTGMAAWLNVNPAPYQGFAYTFIQQFVVAVIVPLLAASLPIYNAVRVTVREAISDYGIGGNAKPPKRQSIGRSALWLSRPIRLSLRNAVRRKTRLALTLFTMVLGGAIFIAVFNLWASFDQAMIDVQGYFLADVNIPFGRSYRLEEVASIAQSVTGVSSVEGWAGYGGTLIMDREKAGTQIVFTAPPSTSTLIDPVITSGRWLRPGDENAVVVGNYLLIMHPEVKVGDWLTIEMDGRETQWKVIGTYVITGNVGVPYLYVNYEYLSKLIGRPGQVYSVRILTEKHDAATQDRIRDEVEALYKERGIQFGTSQLGSEFIANQKASTDIFVYFMMVMAVLIAVVGGLGLMGTMSISVLERTREIGVMRAIGASNFDIQTIVIFEGMTIGLISWLIAVLLSVPITGILCYGVGVGILTAPLPPVYNPQGIIVWLIGTLILAAIASALPARGASRLTVKDTLAYE